MALCHRGKSDMTRQDVSIVLCMGELLLNERRRRGNMKKAVWGRVVDFIKNQVPLWQSPHAVLLKPRAT